MRCPCCGNTDPRKFETNGLHPRHPEYTVLCTAQVNFEDSSWANSFTADEFRRDYPEHCAGNDVAWDVQCGMQWNPNAQDTREHLREADSYRWPD